VRVRGAAGGARCAGIEAVIDRGGIGVGEIAGVTGVAGADDLAIDAFPVPVVAVLVK
jgi:hypothetical protein